MNNTLRKLLVVLGISIFFAAVPMKEIVAQSSFSFKTNEKTFVAKEIEAALVDMNKEKFIQIHVTNGDKVAYLYLKYDLIKDLPTSLKYADRNEANNKSPEAEIIWAPDGAENPQWNTVKGKIVVTSLDLEKKLVSGTFEFKVEKFEYSSNGNNNRPSLEIAEGQFSNIQYR